MSLRSTCWTCRIQTLQASWIRPIPTGKAGLPSNMCILSGFPSTPNKTATTRSFPFGIWFADANTLYAADEGDGYTGGADLFTHAAAQSTTGLQKWVFNAATKKWVLAYTLQNGLDLGKPYKVQNYPLGENSADPRDPLRLRGAHSVC